jgi:uncharacterized membrane protein YhaH (DUF805 family)
LEERVHYGELVDICRRDRKCSPRQCICLYFLIPFIGAPLVVALVTLLVCLVVALVLLLVSFIFVSRVVGLPLLLNMSAESVKLMDHIKK